tara:strand:+ start:325 stop:468 length:144 start_codon:yes stop_codon:yes gene_type:complete
MDLPEKDLVSLEGSIGDSAATDGGRLAPGRFSLILELEVEKGREASN